jgi:hypothetical protein
VSVTNSRHPHGMGKGSLHTLYGMALWYLKFQLNSVLAGSQLIFGNFSVKVYSVQRCLNI